MNKTTLKITTVMIAALGVAMGSALAKGHPHEGQRRGEQMFDKADINGDGQISADEIEAAKKKSFAKMDVDGDGYLTEADREVVREQRQQKRAKMREKMQERRAERLEKIDSNGDGKISEREFMAAESGRLDKLDQNQDGLISKEEAEDAQGKLRPGARG